ncbi:putative lipid II flippase MurJ [Muricauda sp. NBRC 101325]|nr:putative lipid II flippase MurJ [Muricauda sp. NBRC 101325]
MFTVAMVSLLVKGIGFFKEIIIADTYGVSELLDTYLIAVLVPTYVQNVFLNSYNSVFIPNYVYEKQDANGNIGSFQGSNFLIAVLFSLFMVFLTYLAIDLYLKFLFPGHTEQYYHLIKIQLWIILPCMIFWGLSSLISGLLTVDNEFLHSSLNGIFVPLTTIIFLFAFYNVLQEKTLALGMLVGSVLSFLYLVIVAFKKKIIVLSYPNFKGPNLRLMLKQVPAKISSSLIHGLNPIVDQYYSAQLAVGAIATLNYGSKIPIVVLSLISAPMVNTLLPFFSKKALEGPKILYSYLKRVLGGSIITMGLLSIILILLSKFIITLLFERGTFTSNDTESVYVIQQLYLIQLPFYICAIVMNKYLNSINKNNFLVLSSIVNLILNIILNYFFLQWMGIKGIALATSIVYLVNASIIFLYIWQLNKSQTAIGN